MFKPMKITFVNGKKYGLVIINDYNRWTWVKFIRHEDESHSVFSTFCSQVQNEKDLKIVKVIIDHDGEFKNKYFEKLFYANASTHYFFCPITP